MNALEKYAAASTIKKRLYQLLMGGKEMPTIGGGAARGAGIGAGVGASLGGLMGVRYARKFAKEPPAVQAMFREMGYSPAMIGGVGTAAGAIGHGLQGAGIGAIVNAVRKGRYLKKARGRARTAAGGAGVLGAGGAAYALGKNTGKK